MAKHRKHKKHGSPQPDNRRLGECEICNKRFPLEQMFVVMGDIEHQRFILAAYPEQMTIFFSDFDEELGLVCATSQCIVRSFVKWRVWDEQTRRQNEVMGGWRELGLVPKRESEAPAGEEQPEERDAVSSEVSPESPA